jgi:hypothetical protein
LRVFTFVLLGFLIAASLVVVAAVYFSFRPVDLLGMTQEPLARSLDGEVGGSSRGCSDERDNGTFLCTQDADFSGGGRVEWVVTTDGARCWTATRRGTTHDEPAAEGCIGLTDILTAL